ncbi:macro domain-containing protein [Streptomyces griseoaurantiacus]|uniref:macro domain-containing protein n=1 Tax=Streptomyces griseoaurantiacus TaxID=68213 RepID=UPI003864B966
MNSGLLKSRRWWRRLAGRTIVTFGVISSVPQLYLALWPNSAFPRGVTLVAIVCLSITASLARSLPASLIQRDFDRPQISVAVKIGDLFDEASHLVIGFNDVFDTDSSDGVVISPTSVQGQFQNKIYNNNLANLDRDLHHALVNSSPISRETRHDKPRGKLDRYPIGTVAVLGGPERRFFCVAYGRMRNDLTVRSSVDDIWRSLDQLWESLDAVGQRAPVAMPVVGSEMARINHLDREVLLRMILLSFVSHSRQQLVSKKLTILIHPRDAHLVNLTEVEAFLRVL